MSVFTSRVVDSTGVGLGKPAIKNTMHHYTESQTLYACITKQRKIVVHAHKYIITCQVSICIKGSTLYWS